VKATGIGDGGRKDGMEYPPVRLQRGMLDWLIELCLTPLSTVFQLYRGEIWESNWYTFSHNYAASRLHQYKKFTGDARRRTQSDDRSSYGPSNEMS
jgi:hypothetical protein